MLSLKLLYEKEITKDLQKRFNYKNVMQIPKIEKICLNMGVGEAVLNSKVMDSALDDMTRIAGQKPVATKAKKSISVYKLREGMRVGCKATLRDERMYEFLERLVYVALPRVRDFRGLSSKSFNGKGSYCFGLKEQIVFPEIDYDKVDKVRGLDIAIVTTAKTDEEGKALLELFKMPFVK